MKIGVFVNYPGVDGYEKKIQEMTSLGFDNCQLCSWSPELWTDEAVETINAINKKYGITVSAFWCGWQGKTAMWNFYEGQLTLGLVPPEDRALRVKNLCDGSDFAKKLGITDIITHMGFIPENPYDPNFEPFCDAVREVAQHMEKNGQYLLFETGQETPVTLLRCFETVGTKNLGVNLDTGNLILYGKANPVDALDVIGKYVRNLHAKDGFYPTDGRHLGREVRVGDGKANFPALIKGLKDMGYERYITIERECDGEEQIRDILYTKNYLQSLIDAD